jgi:hypothetical protein
MASCDVCGRRLVAKLDGFSVVDDLIGIAPCLRTTKACGALAQRTFANPTIAWFKDLAGNILSVVKRNFAPADEEVRSRHDEFAEA